jgi:integrase
VPRHQTLTELAIRATDPPPIGTVTLWDGSLKHFGLRVSRGGAKSFIVLLGSGRRQAIGRWPTITLAQARTKAKTILAERTLGKHQPRSITWADARDRYVESIKEKNRPTTAYEYERILNKHFPFGNSQLSAITKQQILAKLDKCKKPSMRKHLMVAAKIFFTWAQRQGYLDQHPMAGLAHAKQPQRDRVLTDAELQSVWKVAEAGGQFGAIIKLLILTGQRRGEIAALRREWICNCTITLPKEITKNGREHSFPLASLSASLITSLCQGENRSLLFAAPGKPSIPFNGWSKSKAALDKASGVNDWTLHDLRRTFATRLAELGVAPHVIERLLNHVSGTISGIAAVYNRAKYQEEMRAAVEVWERRVTTMLQSQK